MKTIYHLLTIILAFLASNCVQPPNYPAIPAIEYVGMNQQSIEQGNSTTRPDTLEITFSFTDGDGDLGFGPGDSTVDIFLTDSREGFTDIKKLPMIPDQGIGNGISGEITVRLPNRLPLCCTYADNSTPCQPHPTIKTDTMSYTIQIKDRAGNMSNKIQTEVITILCN